MANATKVVDKEYLGRQFANYNNQIVKPQFIELENAVNDKVDSKLGFGLSENNFTQSLKTKLENLENYDDSEIIAAINLLNADAKTEGSVANSIADAISSIVAGANSDFDTLKEIADWISGHASSAAEMNSQISDNKSAINKLNSDENTEGSVAYAIKQINNALSYEYETDNIDFYTLEANGDGLDPEEKVS